MTEKSEKAADEANGGEPKGGRPGPVDHGHEGGMATRELAPELTEPERDQDG